MTMCLQSGLGCGLCLKVEMHEQVGIVKMRYCLLLSFVYCCSKSGLTNEHRLECLLFLSPSSFRRGERGGQRVQAR